MEKCQNEASCKQSGQNRKLAAEGEVKEGGKGRREGGRDGSKGGREGNKGGREGGSRKKSALARRARRQDSSRQGFIA